jgi:hypothetical protein
MSSSEMWRCVHPGLTNVMEEHIASIFRVEKSPLGKPASAGDCRLRLNTCSQFFNIRYYKETGSGELQKGEGRR